jgi:peptidoglycan/LPS O-acetylase OafA/YrhL
MWPLYLVVLHVFGLWLVAKLVWGHDTNVAFQAVQPVVSVTEWVRQLAGVQMWDHAYLDGASWVGPTWSLSAEWLAYLLFPGGRARVPPAAAAARVAAGPSRPSR